MTRRLRIAIASAIILVGLVAILVISFLIFTHTSVGQERVRRMVSTMLQGRVRGKVYLGHMSGGLVGGVRIDSVEIRDDEDSVFFASGPITVAYDPRDQHDQRNHRSQHQAAHLSPHIRLHANKHWNFRSLFPASVENDNGNQRAYEQYNVM